VCIIVSIRAKTFNYNTSSLCVSGENGINTQKRTGPTVLWIFFWTWLNKFVMVITGLHSVCYYTNGPSLVVDFQTSFLTAPQPILNDFCIKHNCMHPPRSAA